MEEDRWIFHLVMAANVTRVDPWLFNSSRNKCSKTAAPLMTLEPGFITKSVSRNEGVLHISATSLGSTQAPPLFGLARIEAVSGTGKTTIEEQLTLSHSSRSMGAVMEATSIFIYSLWFRLLLLLWMYLSLEVSICGEPLRSWCFKSLSQQLQLKIFIYCVFELMRAPLIIRAQKYLSFLTYWD